MQYRHSEVWPQRDIAGRLLPVTTETVDAHLAEWSGDGWTLHSMQVTNAVVNATNVVMDKVPFFKHAYYSFVWQRPD